MRVSHNVPIGKIRRAQILKASQKVWRSFRFFFSGSVQSWEIYYRMIFFYYRKIFFFQVCISEARIVVTAIDN